MGWMGRAWNSFETSSATPLAYSNRTGKASAASILVYGDGISNHAWDQKIPGWDSSAIMSFLLAAVLPQKSGHGESVTSTLLAKLSVRDSQVFSGWKILGDFGFLAQ
jgi:hypothetical protein